MKSAALVLATLLVAAPAHAQLGGLINKAQKAKDTVNKVSDLKISDKEERLLGEQVSVKLREEFGVMQDEKVTKYVSLVGSVLGQLSSRPNLDWQFIVLDTDGVNAFAAPGGIVHITRGALGLMKTEAELAGALGHEITHITEKHTVKSIQKSNTISFTADEAPGGGGLAGSLVTKLAEAAYKNIINNQFDRNDEVEADKIGVTLANKAGYAPGALTDVLTRIADRNKDRAEPNGMFASHPLIKDRIDNIGKTIKDGKLAGTATVQARYASMITFDVKAITDIELIAGVRGLTGGSDASKDSKDSKDAKKEEPKPKKSLLGKFSTSSSEQKQSSQTIASAGARGGVPDRDSKGGDIKTVVVVKVTAAEVADFKKGITA